MPIRVLDAETVGRIAAGEVVERPASIAKELIENSLDAGATSITIEMRDGGCSYLRVTDNGCGIPPEEARIAFENHATSKITSGDQLSDILTLGFRGEALPSIAAVSKVTMTTRMRGKDAGIKLTVEGGMMKDVSAAGCPEGTSIVVQDLFFNTPVRRGFLKKPATEGGVLADMVARLILGNPGVAIRLVNNGKNVYHSFGDGDIRHAALAVYGRETAEKLTVIDETEGAFRIQGLIGTGDLEKANRSHQFFFINGRVVRCALLTQALEAATRSLVTIGQHPMCALSLHLAPHSVDINVHPSKLEVRFRDEASVRMYAESLLSRGIFQGKMLEPEKATAVPKPIQTRPAIQVIPAGTRIPPMTKPQEQTAISSVTKETAVSVMPERKTAVWNAPAAERQPAERIIMPDRSKISAVLQEPERPVQQKIVSEPASVKTAAPDAPSAKPVAAEQIKVAFAQAENAQPEISLKVLGVFANTYILVEFKDTLLIIDQHAAHERIRYQEYEKALHRGNASQQLLTPVILSLSPRERGVLLSNQELLLQAGYEVEPFGERDIQVRAVPHVLGQAELRPLFLEMVDQLDQLKGATIDRRRAEVIQASCKRAVKAGDRLSEAEIRALIDEMLKTDAPPTCPHGRPVLRAMRKAEIERMFKRI